MGEPIPSPSIIETSDVRFFNYNQVSALHIFAALLAPHLPHSNPIYNRLQSPQNTPDRKCIYAATFPPPSSKNVTPEIYTLLFGDPSRPHESQIWLFNPLITINLDNISSDQKRELRNHMHSVLLFLKTLDLPESIGWPPNPVLKIACLHETLSRAVIEIAEEHGAFVRCTEWRHWILNYQLLLCERASRKREELKEPLFKEFTVARVPEAQLSIVMETSLIPRQPSTLLRLPNAGLLNADGKLVAWVYLSMDRSLATMYVLPEYRGRGLATYVALQLLGMLEKGRFKDLGYGEGMESGWVHADVAQGNKASEGVMRSLGATTDWETWYVSVDCGKIRSAR